MDINENTIDNLVERCWAEVKTKIEKGHELSSEKTLCFLFAIELLYQVGHKLCIDFENQCFKNLEGESKYLDLLFYTASKFKVAIEFKLPQKTDKGGSNTTQTRSAVYRDLARLNYLKTADISPKACYFLMAANEGSYFNRGQYKKNIEFITAHNHNVSKTNNLVVQGIPMNGMAFSFDWEGIEIRRKKLACSGVYSWLKPIRV